MVDSAVHWETLAASWKRSLRAQGKSERTQQIYLDAGSLLTRWLEEHHPKTAPADLRRAHLEEFLIAFAEGEPMPGVQARKATRSPAYVSQTYRALQQWCAWLVEEGELDSDPTARMQAPTVPDKIVPVLTEEQLKSLLRVCVGKRFVDRRDTALIRLLVDSGGRLAEIHGIGLPGDLDLDAQTATVLGKGSKPRVVAFGPRTAEALDRYLRIRAADRWGSSSALWLGERNKGPLSKNGIYLALKRRGQAAGIEGLHPHQFRHTFAARWLERGGQERDLMHLAGWDSPQMVGKYGRFTAAQRARDAHRRLGPAEDL